MVTLCEAQYAAVDLGSKDVRSFGCDLGKLFARAQAGTLKRLGLEPSCMRGSRL